LAASDDTAAASAAASSSSSDAPDTSPCCRLHCLLPLLRQHWRLPSPTTTTTKTAQAPAPPLRSGWWPVRPSFRVTVPPLGGPAAAAVEGGHEVRRTAYGVRLRSTFGPRVLAPLFSPTAATADAATLEVRCSHCPLRPPTLQLSDSEVGGSRRSRSSGRQPGERNERGSQSEEARTRTADNTDCSRHQQRPRQQLQRQQRPLPTAPTPTAITGPTAHKRER
jgi:hypothetical protein